ncbi:putative peroxidase-related enzyme [Rhodopirellula rubra]|uniref:Putative peroxidase-related enzyme n=1 Tax=Aporhodopirellula rubra TaxID=980271 RepID=A0A7W5H413_9BACT|nr:carboxymuconolactone decarboxylase family protein [Aporhodopirellula rubra]MBB3204366.1 putative peroxidase-related enzyme [Aporhodopirellula rubra]
MADFTLHTTKTAPNESKEMLEQSQKAYGFVPNLHAAMAESPALLEAYKTIAGVFGKTDLSETERQVIAMTNNRLNGCQYCMAAHTSIMQSAKVPEDVITSLRNNSPIADSKLEALRTFAEAVNVKRGWVDDSDINALLAAGYTKQTVFDVIVGTAYKVLSNYTNHIAQTPLDPAFADNEWSEETQPA